MHTLTVVFLPLLVTQVYTCFLYLILVKSIQFSLLSWIIRSYSGNLFKIVNMPNTVLEGTRLPIPKTSNMYIKIMLSESWETLKSSFFNNGIKINWLKFHACYRSRDWVKIQWEVGNEVYLPLPLYYFTCVTASSVQPETLVSISLLGHRFFFINFELRRVSSLIWL